MKIIFFAIFSLLSATALQAQYHLKDPGAIPLHGTWQFALDPAEAGVAAGWFTPKVKHGFDQVTVPHCFTVDPRFAYYTGTAWYRKTFHWKPRSGKRVILNFDAAYYRTDVWLNETKVGTHEGGYTPFRFDITDLMKEGENLLTVSVNNNTWKHGTIPGAREENQPYHAFPGWLNFGGITRPVYLTEKEPVYVENIKIEASPDLSKGTALLRVKLRIRNTSSETVSPQPVLTVTREQQPLRVRWKPASTPIRGGQTGVWEAEAALPAAQVALWSVDAPHLYNLTAALGKDTLRSNFGIRKVEVSGTRLLLNGQPIKAAGGNRVIDYKGYGALEPDWLVEKDFRLMKEAGMELHRLTHYTPSEYFYDLADRYGMLIISEAGNWNMSPGQMDTDSIRANFRQQFREMAERDWNHPSVFAYSVGNEYPSTHPAGHRWTRDMIDFARGLDSTRLYTFVSMYLNRLPAKSEDEASRYVDFVCTNTYSNHVRSLDHIHKLYPDKPVLLSEWGLRADAAGGEAAQAAHIRDVMKIVRDRPYLIGASIWTFNDYESRYHYSSREGQRPWGIVTHGRDLRPAYEVHQREASPVVLEKTGFSRGNAGIHTLTIKLTVRNDFPAYAIRNYTLTTGGKHFPVPPLQPGEQVTLELPVTGFEDSAEVAVLKPGGFQILKQSFSLD